MLRVGRDKQIRANVHTGARTFLERDDGQAIQEVIENLLALLGKDGSVDPDWNDEIVIGVTVAHDGHITHAATAEALGLDVVALTATPKEGE